MVVGVCDIGGSLGVQCTVALDLVGIRTGIAIEEIAVVHPDMIVALLQAAVIALTAVAVHKADVAHLHVGAVFHDQTKSVEYGVRTDTLNGNTGLCRIDHQIALRHICWIGDVAEKPQTQRALFLIFLISSDDILHAGHICRTLACGINACSYGILVGIRHIYNNCIFFQRAVLVIRTGRRAFHKAETASVVRLHIQRSCFPCLGLVFLSADNRNNFQLVASSCQSRHIHTKTGGVLPYQHIIHQRITAAGLDINMVIRGTAHSVPLRIGGFQCALCSGKGNAGSARRCHNSIPRCRIQRCSIIIRSHRKCRSCCHCGKDNRSQTAAKRLSSTHTISSIQHNLALIKLFFHTLFHGLTRAFANF